MTALAERIDSRKWNNGELSTTWVLTGTDDDATAVALLDSSLPAQATNPLDNSVLIREQTFTVEPLCVNTTDGSGTWECQVRYIKPDRQRQEPSAINDVRIRGTIGGAPQHVTCSLETVTAYGTGSNVADHGGLINVVDDKAEGVDTDASTFTFTVTKVFAGNGLPTLATLYALRGTTNNASWTVTDSVSGLSITLAAGEGRLLSVSFGESRADGGVEFTYEIGASPNRTNQRIGGITGIAIGGWQYLWAFYEKKELAGLKDLTLQATAAYVERMFDAGAWTGLGL